MSQANFNPNFHPRSQAPVTALTSTQISYYSDHVTIRVPNGQWNEALQEQAQSANMTPDPRAIAELIASERSQPATNQGVATAARPVLHSDSRDAIPLTYCNRTRRIIALVGFAVSSVTILGVHMAALSDRVPGFQPLSIPGFSNDPEKSRQSSLFAVGNLGSLGIVFSVMFMCLFNCIKEDA